MQVGEIYNETSFPGIGNLFSVNGRRHTKFTFKVLRICSQHEYILSCLEEYGTKPILILDYFYEISID